VPASDVKPWLALAPAFAVYGHALPLSRKGYERGKRPTSGSFGTSFAIMGEAS